MWAFFARRLRMWLFLAIGVPLLAWLLGRIGDVIESRNGPTGTSRSLQKARGWLRSHSTGPLARRDGDLDRRR
jgi:hypothetical protein